MSNRKSNSHARLLCSVAGAALLMSASGVHAEDAKRINIAPQSLASALHEFGVQSGHQVLFKSSATVAKTSPGAVAEGDVEVALNQLLAGTGMSFRRAGDVFLIEPEGASDPQSGSAAGDGADGTVQALIVTAQKREENIQDVPIAMSAFTQEALERSQVAGGPDLMTQVPNMTFTKTNFSSYSIQLRGIGTQAISATVDPAVAVAFNNTPFIRNRFFEQEFYDLQRVEVLRGPQGTLYGRNATAGVVNLISQKPKFTYEAKLSADVANYSSTRLEGMVNLPLVEDKVALRLAGAWTKREGYATNGVTGNPIDGRDLWSTRLSLRFAPTDSIDVNLIWEHFNEDDDRLRSGKQLCKRYQPETIAGLPVNWGGADASGGTFDEMLSQGCEAASLYSPDSFQAPNGLRLPYYRPLSRVGLPVVLTTPDGKAFDPYSSTTQSRDLRVIESTVDPTYRAETNLLELQASVDIRDDLTLTSETAYLSDTLFSSQDFNRFNTRPGIFLHEGSRDVVDENGVFCDPQIGCANRLVGVDLSTADSVQFSQELRLASNYDGPFNFSLGANFLRYDTEDKYYVFFNTLTLGAASRALYYGGQVNPYVGGVTDNTECLPRGYRTPAIGHIGTIQDCIYIDPNPITNLNDLGHNYFLSRNPYKLISYAVFGEAYYNISDTLKLTAGMRWTVDKKEAPRIPSWILSANNVGYPVFEVIEQEWREPTGRLTLDWKPNLGFTDQTLLYASYAHGYKAGGANPPAAGLVIYGQIDNTLQSDINFELMSAQQEAVAPRRFGPEFIDAFELGSKNQLFDGALTLNGAAFYYDYKGYQISQIVNRAAINLNFDARVWGLELEADWRPLENLRLGLKGGYEQTRMADGSRAVDTMDRTAGNPDWIVVSPYPTLPANCVLPTYLVKRPEGVLQTLNMSTGGNLGPCEYAYVLGVDPFTYQPYQANPPSNGEVAFWYEGYPGFDPVAGTAGHRYTGQNTYNGHDYGAAPNGGAGFYKDLSGNELPNAPTFTATITADYTVPLPADWLMTLHTDLYYQSEAWTRVFNTEGYDKLKAYTNVNLAAIFANGDAGWKVMAYVKNVFDRDSITGAFLNSDDTGLTTNVFLTEPRLYGLRVTKEFSGGPWWTGASAGHTGPHPLTIELSGQVQRHDAPYEEIIPSFVPALSEALQPQGLQNRDLDWGDGRELRVTYRPAGSSWNVAAAVRYGRANNDVSRLHLEEQGPKACGFPAGTFGAQRFCDPGSPYYSPTRVLASYDVLDSSARSKEEHTVVDFEVGHDVGLGLITSMTAGVRYASLSSATVLSFAGKDETIPEGFFFCDFGPQYCTTQDRLAADLTGNREFEGWGPTLGLEAVAPILGSEGSSRLSAEAALKVGLLFGKARTVISGNETTQLYSGYVRSSGAVDLFPVGNPTVTPVAISRNEGHTVPVVDLSLGLAYEVGRVKVGAGYRWERYFDVLDVGYQEKKDADRTIDGPYFKIAVGFGG